jgi:hypothetical protein
MAFFTEPLGAINIPVHIVAHINNVLCLQFHAVKSLSCKPCIGFPESVREDCSVVEYREKIGQGSELLKEGFPFPFTNCPDDLIVEGCTITELLHQYAQSRLLLYPKGRAT